MQKIGFTEALDSIVAHDPRYARDAYVFLRDSLDFTTKQQKKIKGATVRHVAGPELLEGVRQYALREFGPMVMTVFEPASKLLQNSQLAPYFLVVGRAAIWLAPSELRARFYQGLDLVHQAPQKLSGSQVPPK